MAYRRLMRRWTAALRGVSDSPGSEARWMVERVTGRRAPFPDIGESEAVVVDGMVRDRVERRKPLAFVLGDVPFLGLSLECAPPCLVPRPETEEWCAWVAGLLAADAADGLVGHGDATPAVVDLCTGSGNVALGIACVVPGADVVAADDAPDALALLARNRDRCAPALAASSSRVTPALCDVTDAAAAAAACGGGGRFDAVVGNPPYIAAHAWASLQPEVRDWEDPHALVAGEGGLAVLRAIVSRTAPALLRPRAAARRGGRARASPELVLEFGDEWQAGPLLDAARRAGFARSDVRRDLFGKQRVLVASR